MKQASIPEIIQTLQKKMGIVGRDKEIALLVHCVRSGKHVLLEGPVGVGKTHLVSAVAKLLGKAVTRVDGDARYTEHKLTGWFDPPTVLKKGYSSDSYFEGPLVEAMKAGGILFLNELNRMPEGVQNVLLPALDERKIEVPRIGEIKAKEGFCVIATQNPREFVATSHLSEALLDRFELVTLRYQNEAEEKEILQNFTKGKENATLLDWSVHLIRGTRSSVLFKRGASIRAGISIYDLAQSMGGSWDDFLQSALIALPTRVELSEEGLELGFEKSLQALTDPLKKKAKSGS